MCLVAKLMVAALGNPDPFRGIYTKKFLRKPEKMHKEITEIPGANQESSASIASKHNINI